MDISSRKEQFSIAYVNAIAAHAGVNNAHFSVDDDSIDLVLAGKNFRGKIRNPQLQLQLKCTSQDLIKDGVIKFPLSKKNYDDLRGTDVLCPRYLAVLIIPKDETHWLDHGNDELILKNSCYWVSLRDMPASSNKTTITVDIPLQQKLTTDALSDLMREASNGVMV